MTRHKIAMAVWIALLVPVLYAIESAFFYTRYLDWRLDFVRPKLGFAPEDVLGFGFWVTWTIFFVLFVTASALALRSGRQHRSYLVWAAVAFLVVSVVDFALFSRLQEQVFKL